MSIADEGKPLPKSLQRHRVLSIAGQDLAQESEEIFTRCWIFQKYARKLCSFPWMLLRVKF